MPDVCAPSPTANSPPSRAPSLTLTVTRCSHEMGVAEVVTSNTSSTSLAAVRTTCTSLGPVYLRGWCGWVS